MDFLKIYNKYDKFPRILYIKMVYANSADLDKSAPALSDQGLHCLPFH